jgi:1,4-alpha-glucan branching enzyme
MEILHITGEYPPVVSGGLGRYVEAVATRSAVRGHDVSVHLVEGAPDSFQEREREPSTVDLTRTAFDPARVERLSSGVHRVDDLRRALDVPAGDPDIVHVHDWYGVFEAAVLADDPNCRLVMSSHLPMRAGFTYEGHPIDRRAKVNIEALGFRLADRVTAPSSFTMETLATEYDVPNSRLTVVPNGVDTEYYTPSATGATPPIVLAAGRLTAQKGFGYLLDAVAALPEDREYRVEIVGEGPGRQQLEARAAELGIADRLSFAGYLPDDALRERYRRAAVTVFPSVYEPFGLVALESMAAGTPVVAFETGGVPEFVDHGEQGLLVPPGDADATAAAVDALLADPDRRARMGEQARRRAEQFDWGVVVDNLEALYEEVAV